MTTDRLSAMFRLQYEQQDLIEGGRPEARPEARAMAKEYAARLHGEVEQYLQGIDSHAFIPREVPRSTRVLDIVDLVKYSLCIAWAEGVTAAEFFEAFDMKTRMVTERFTREVRTSKIAGFDIDGVLAEYKDWWTEDPTEAQFIESGGLLTLRPVEGARELLADLKEDGWSVVLVTARKLHRFGRIESDTHDWLQANDIPYDIVLYGYDKMAQIKPFGAEFKFFVEDSPKHALDVASAGIPVFHMKSPDGRAFRHPNIHPVESYSDVRFWLRFNGLWREVDG